MSPPWLQPLYQRLSSLYDKGALSHALLLVGPEGVGQSELAMSVAATILCSKSGGACGNCHACQLCDALSHPDMHILDGREEGIKVDAIRSLVRQVSQTPQIGRSKVVVIHQAEAMNSNAANALLKGLEEPPPDTYFVLTSNQAAGLIATIRSRCLMMTLDRPDIHQVEDWLQGKFPESSVSQLFWLTTEPYRLQAIFSSELAEFYLSLPERLLSYLSGNLSAEEFTKGVDSSSVYLYVDALLALLQQCLVASASRHDVLWEPVRVLNDRLLQRLGPYKLLDCFQSLQALKLAIGKSNLNPVMQLKAEMISWIN